MALAFIGALIVLISIQADDAEAAPIPNIGSTTYYVTTNTVWDSGSATWAGNIYVQSPATLTMKNVRVTWTASYRYFRVYDGAKVVWEDVTMTSSSSSYYYYLYFYQNAQVRINDSYIQYCYYNYVYGWNQRFTNTTFIDGYYMGAYVYAYGVNWNNAGPVFCDNLIINKYYGIYLYMYGATATPIIENNLIMNNQYYGIYLYGGGNGRVQNNSIIKNKSDGAWFYQVGSSFVFNDNIVQNNAGYGITFYYVNAELTIYNNVINQNSNNDLYLYSSKIRSVNNTIGKVSAQQDGELNVYWVLDVYVGWEDGSGPAVDADVTFMDAKEENLIPDDTTGSDGWIHNIEVKEYSWKQSGKNMYSPYTINASKFDIQASVKVDVNKNTVAKLVLDNVPPILLVESPVDKSLTSNNNVQVRGLTEPGATCTVNNINVEVGDNGWFETWINFSSDGTHDIDIAAWDTSLNSVEMRRTITIDTKAPTLSIVAPEEGVLTNEPLIEVIGETEPGAFATIDGQTVTVDQNGRFCRLLTMTEGQNTFSLRVWDKAGNYQEGEVSAQLDTTPPKLMILEPIDHSSVSTQEIKVVGFVEDGSTLTINGVQVRYQGGTFQQAIRLFDGENLITVEALDLAGNFVSKSVTVSLDLDPPKLEILSPCDNTVSNHRRILVIGETDIGSTVTVNGEAADVEPGTGYFELSISLKSGNNKISVVATDSHGNIVSETITVVYDSDPPELTLLTPENGTVTNQDSIRVEGIVSHDATVTVNGKEVPVDKGKFSAHITLEEGENEVLVIARDDALNSKSDRVVVIRDSTVDLRVAFPYDGMYTYDDIINVTGSTDIGGEVYINKNLKAPVDFYGKFKVQVSLEEGINEITVTSTDPLGNSGSVTMYVTREIPVVVPVKKDTGKVATTDNTWLIALAAVLGIVVGTAIMGGFYLMSRKRMEERNQEKVEELVKEREKEILERLSKGPAPPPEDAPPQVPRGYRGPPPHIPRAQARPLQAATTSYQPAPAGPLPPPPSTPRSLRSIQGETTAPSEDTEVEIDAEVSEAEKRLREVESTGADTTKPRNSLKLAKFFMQKGDKEKMGKYIRKTHELLDELSGGGS